MDRNDEMKLGAILLMMALLAGCTSLQGENTEGSQPVSETVVEKPPYETEHGESAVTRSNFSPCEGLLMLDWDPASNVNGTPVAGYVVRLYRGDAYENLFASARQVGLDSEFYGSPSMSWRGQTNLTFRDLPTTGQNNVQIAAVGASGQETAPLMVAYGYSGSCR